MCINKEEKNNTRRKIIAMKETNDPRVKRTRRFLKDALLVLIKEKGFDAITVRDLTDAAEINRATFYQHYHDKFDLLDQTIDDMLCSLGTHVEPKSLEELTKNNETIPIYLRMFEFISEHSFFFQVMMGENGVSFFQRRLLSIINKFMNKKLDQLHLEPEKMKIPKEIFIQYISFANLGLISYWLENDMKYSAKYMAKQLSELTERGPFFAVGLNTQCDCGK
jgi:AcrR family transcriptional regulator